MINWVDQLKSNDESLSSLHILRKLTESDLLSLLSALKTNTVLRSLSYRYEISPEISQALVDLLNEKPNLEIDFKIPSEYLSKLTGKLKKLVIYKTDLSIECEVDEVVAYESTVNTIKSFNKLTLFECVVEKLGSVKELKMYGCDVNEVSSEMGTEVLCVCMTEKTKLKIKLNENLQELTLKNVQDINIPENLEKLEKLELSCGLTSFEYNLPLLRELNLSCNSIKSLKVKTLKTLILFNNCLERLEFEFVEKIDLGCTLIKPGDLVEIIRDKNVKEIWFGGTLERLNDTEKDEFLEGVKLLEKYVKVIY